MAREFRAWPRQNGRGLISKKNKYIMSARFVSKSTNNDKNVMYIDIAQKNMQNCP